MKRERTMAKKLSKAKPKKRMLDKYTYGKLRRDKHCFEPDHLYRLEQYALSTSVCEARVIQLEERLKTAVEQSVVEEEKKTSFSQGFVEGEKVREEHIRKENACFEKKHKFIEGKALRNLNFGEVLSLFAKMLSEPSSGGLMSRLTVLVPDIMAIPSLTQDQMMGVLRSFKVTSVDDIVNPPMLKNIPKKGGLP